MRFTPNSVAAYQKQHAMAHQKLGRIGRWLRSMPAPSNDKSPVHWGHINSVNEINNELERLISTVCDGLD